MGREPRSRTTWPQPTPVRLPSGPELAATEVAMRLRSGIDGISWLCPDGAALQLLLQPEGAIAAPLARAEDGYAIADVAVGWRFAVALGEV